MKNMKKTKIINQINSYNDFLKIDKSNYELLANEIRELIIELAKTKEIHYGSNLGIVELSIALSSSFNLNHDKIIYDTGHQSYVHKILTGRKNLIQTIRDDQGLSAFTDMEESKYDFYSPGHCGNTISLLAGISENNKNNYNVTVIGDSSLNTGVSYEGLNISSFYNANNIIVLNDNQMSISECVGSLNKSFNYKELTKGYFNALGYEYIGIIDGHNFNELFKSFELAKKLIDNKKNVIVHVKTIKAKGDAIACLDKLGNSHANTLKTKPSFGEIAAKNLAKKLKSDNDLYILNPAMNIGTGFIDLYKNKHPRYYDTGISESHTLSFGSGLLLDNKKVIFLYYSTFLQRGYDQLIHDISRLNLKPIILIDRADLATGDGPSHHGTFDVGFLKTIPNTKICSPRNYEQLNKLIDYAYTNLDNKNNNDIICIRYPKSVFINSNIESTDNIQEFEYLINNNSNNLLISYGPYIDVISNYFKENNIDCDIVNSIWINNIKKDELHKLFSKYKKIICYERIYSNLGLANELLLFKNNYHLQNELIIMNYQSFPKKGSLKTVDSQLNMDLDAIIKKI